MCLISVSKDVLHEFLWLFELQSRISHMCGNDGRESLSEGKWRDREMKILMGENLPPLRERESIQLALIYLTYKFLNKMIIAIIHFK